MFQCSKCGECCKNLDKAAIYSELHNGDGICRYLVKNECSIYNDRPLLCRVDQSYELFFKEMMTYEEYLQLNYKSCEILKQRKREE